MIDRIIEHIEQLRDELAEIRIGKLPFVPIVGWEVDLGLPMATPAVYFLVSRSRGLLYIGRATDLRERWSPLPLDLLTDYPAHARRRPAIVLGDVSLHWLAMPRGCIETAECIMLQIHGPPWNTARG